MYFSLPLITSLLAILPLSTTTPLKPRSIPFQGKGKLAIVYEGEKVGWLNSAWKATADDYAAGVFNSTLVWGNAVYGDYQIKNSAGVNCGYKYIFQHEVENGLYQIGCGPEFSGLNVQTRVGLWAYAGWTILSVQINKNFTTPDLGLPVAGTLKNVTTDVYMYRPTSFEIGWVAV